MKILRECYIQRFEALMSNHFLELLFNSQRATTSPLQFATDYCVPAAVVEVVDCASY
jgi:hypothetical protein